MSSLRIVVSTIVNNKKEVWKKLNGKYDWWLILTIKRQYNQYEHPSVHGRGNFFYSLKRKKEKFFFHVSWLLLNINIPTVRLSLAFGRWLNESIPVGLNRLIGSVYQCSIIVCIDVVCFGKNWPVGWSDCYSCYSCCLQGRARMLCYVTSCHCS